jgi:hypothetical protein
VKIPIFGCRWSTLAALLNCSLQEAVERFARATVPFLTRAAVARPSAVDRSNERSGTVQLHLHSILAFRYRTTQLTWQRRISLLKTIANPAAVAGLLTPIQYRSDFDQSARVWLPRTSSCARGAPADVTRAAAAAAAAGSACADVGLWALIG